MRRNPIEERPFVTDIAPTEETNPYFGNPHDPTCVTPLHNLYRLIQNYLDMLDTSPQRTAVSPGISITSMTDITAQISVELGTSDPTPLHQRDMSVIDSQRSMFNTNVDRHVNAFPNINTSCSSSSQPNSLAATPWQMEHASMLADDEGKRGGTAAVLKPNARPLTRSMTAERLQSLITRKLGHNNCQWSGLKHHQ